MTCGEILKCMEELISGDLLQFTTSLHSWYVPCTVKCHLMASSGTVFIDSAMGKKFTYALLAASLAELGIRRTKGPSGLDKTLLILSSLEDSIRLIYFRSVVFADGYKHSRNAGA